VTNGVELDSIKPMWTVQACLASQIRENSTDETRKDALRLNFDRKLKLEFYGTKVTSDAGLPACRELDEALGPTSAIDSELRDNRTPKEQAVQHCSIAQAVDLQQIGRLR